MRTHAIAIEEGRSGLSISVEWYDANQTIILAQVAADWGWGTAQQARASIQQLAQSVSHPLVLIMILPPDISVPPDGFAENSKDALQLHAALGLRAVIYVTTSSDTRTLWQSVIDMYASPAVQYSFASTVDAAVALLS